MNHPEFLRALKQIESFICGGEHLSGELIQLLKLHSRGRIYNQYGPSEATIGVSYQLMNDSPVITIGARCLTAVFIYWIPICSPCPSGFTATCT